MDEPFCIGPQFRRSEPRFKGDSDRKLVTIDHQKEIVEMKYLLSKVQQQFYREVMALLKATDQTHLAQMIFCQKALMGQYTIRLQYISELSLKDLILSEKYTYTAHTVLIYAQQIFRAAAFLHRADINIVHRDIKPENIMVDRNGNLVVIDFEGSVEYDERNSATRDTGSKLYNPPELTPNDMNVSNQFDHKGDVFAIGITLWEIIFRRHILNPSSNLNEEMLIQERRDQISTSRCNAPFPSIIEGCTRDSPQERSTAQEGLDSVEAILTSGRYNGYRKTPQYVAESQGITLPEGLDANSEN